MSETGRRSARRRRLSPTAVIAVLLPLLTVAALALVRPAPPSTTAEAGEEVRPERVDLVCPGPLGEPTLAVAAAGNEVEGEVARSALDGADRTPVEVRADAATSERAGGPVVLRAEGAVAAELIAARFETGGLSSTECPLPRSDHWFSGVGAGADHATVLELDNPDGGPAVADVSVWGRTGPVDVPNLRGLIVPGGESLRLDLAEEVPSRGELAVRVEVPRGRLAVTAEDTVPALGARPETVAWLPESAPPATEQLLLGLVPGSGDDTLVVTNPGDDEARVEVRVVTEEAAFVPEGQDEVRVGAGSVQTVTLGRVLRDLVREGAVGLELVSTEPVTATMRSVVDGDLVHAAPVTGSGSAMTALVPPGDPRLVLGQAGGAGVALVTAYADGEPVTEERVELTDGSGATLDLPQRADLVRVVPRRTDVAAAVVVTGDGATVTPLRELVRRTLVPSVEPGLPQG